LKTLFSVVCLVLLCSHAKGEGDESTIPKFASESAKAAMKSFDSKIAILGEKLNEQVVVAKNELRAGLTKATEEAVAAKDFSEVARISTYLESPQFGETQQVSATERKIITALKVENTKLKFDLKAASEPDPIVGVWDYSNGSVVECVSNGGAVSNGKMVAVWRRVEKSNTYILGYIEKLYADRLVLQSDGNTMELTGPKGSHLRLTRRK
jgi:hypothetical protein